MTTSSPTFPSTGRVFLLAVVAILGVGAALGGLARYVLADDGPTGGCRREVAAAIVTDNASPPPVELLMIDVTSNEPLAAKAIAREFRTVLQRGVRAGVAFELVLDRGPSVPIARDECLDGEKLFLVERNTELRQQRDERSAVAALETHIAEVISSDEIIDPGGPMRLILEGAAEASSLERRGVTVAGVRLYTDFLSNNPAECLYVGEGAATGDRIDAIVESCRRAQHGFPTYPTDLELLGVGGTNRSAGHEQWARDLASSICVEIKGCHLA